MGKDGAGVAPDLFFVYRLRRVTRRRAPPRREEGAGATLFCFLLIRPRKKLAVLPRIPFLLLFTPFFVTLSGYPFAFLNSGGSNGSSLVFSLVGWIFELREREERGALEDIYFTTRFIYGEIAYGCCSERQEGRGQLLTRAKRLKRIGPYSAGAA